MGCHVAQAERIFSCKLPQQDKTDMKVSVRADATGSFEMDSGAPADQKIRGIRPHCISGLQRTVADGSACCLAAI